MLGTVFMNLVRGNTLPNYLGVVGKVNEDYTFYKDYSNIQCKLGYSSKKHVQEGDTVICRPTVKVNPKKCKLLIVPNPILNTVGQVSYSAIIEEGEGEYLQFNIKFTKKFEMDTLDYLCKVYAIYG